MSNASVSKLQPLSEALVTKHQYHASFTDAEQEQKVKQMATSLLAHHFLAFFPC